MLVFEPVSAIASGPGKSRPLQKAQRRAREFDLVLVRRTTKLSCVQRQSRRALDENATDVTGAERTG
jgi:hypothetical protein